VLLIPQLLESNQSAQVFSELVLGACFFSYALLDNLGYGWRGLRRNLSASWLFNCR